METRNNNQEAQNNTGGAGRTHGSQMGGNQVDHENTGRDISSIDQQEGNMNNGVIGGNMGEDVRQHTHDEGSGNQGES